MFKHIEFSIENLFSKLGFFVPLKIKALLYQIYLFLVNKTMFVANKIYMIYQIPNIPNFLSVYFLWNLFCMTSMARSVES